MSVFTGKNCNAFPNGGKFVRADFHLHTDADKEFSYSEDKNKYFDKYVQQLKDSEIQLGVITNHNKFDAEEFRKLRKNALKENIFLLPGVELSIEDGANGIHTLIVFSDKWIEKGQDYINPFLTTVFAGKTPEQYEHGNGRTNDNLVETIKKLETNQHDFFIVFAHVEQDSGLWKELDGGRITELGKNEFFRRRTLGFQKVRTRDKEDRVCRTKVQEWLKDQYPAELEGSDCKSIDEIGKGKPCYLKLGHFSFEAVKHALIDHENRVLEQPGSYSHSYIKNVTFEGGLLDGESIAFSPELNTLIGIRGSGKSAIIEAVRYVLGIQFGEKALDKEYKEELVPYALGSGGKAVIKAVDFHGHEYEIRRILGEDPEVFKGGDHQPGVNIRETILRKPTYFGQKDLSSTGEGFEKDLVDKLIGAKLVEVRGRIKDQQQCVSKAINDLQKLASADEHRKDCESKKQNAEFQLKAYEKHGMKLKLKKQDDFEKDSQHIRRLCTSVEKYLDDFATLLQRHEEDLTTQKSYMSEQNPDFFETFYRIYGELLEIFGEQQQSLKSGWQIQDKLKNKSQGFEKIRESLKEEFADTKRKLSEELKTSGANNVEPDHFLKLRKEIEEATRELDALKKQQTQKSDLESNLAKELTRLDDLWREEFEIIQTELVKINENQPALQIVAEYKGAKEAFVAFMKESFKGSNVREIAFRTLAEQFEDFGAIHQNLESAKSVAGRYSENFEQFFRKNKRLLLNWQPPNRFVIQYHGKELRHHSLGQRASALILFVLSQEENDVIIIDQPEDDLDSKTIYEDVIKLIRRMKCKT